MPYSLYFGKRPTELHAEYQRTAADLEGNSKEMEEAALDLHEAMNALSSLAAEKTYAELARASAVHHSAALRLVRLEEQKVNLQTRATKMAAYLFSVKFAMDLEAEERAFYVTPAAYEYNRVFNLECKAANDKWSSVKARIEPELGFGNYAMAGTHMLPSGIWVRGSKEDEEIIKEGMFAFVHNNDFGLRMNAASQPDVLVYIIMRSSVATETSWWVASEEHGIKCMSCDFYPAVPN